MAPRVNNAVTLSVCTIFWVLCKWCAEAKAGSVGPRLEKWGLKMAEKIRLDRRYYAKGIVAGFKWLSNPVSEKGARQVSRIQMYLQGPNKLKDVEVLRHHPIGAKLLAEKPDLSEAFDMANLAQCPDGSFGKTLHDVLNFPDTIPGYLLAGLSYNEGFFDSLDIDDDLRWYLDRTFLEHDASHVISGYMTDFAGEALNIYFILGHTGDTPRWALPFLPFGLLPLLLRPNIGWRKWVGHLYDAFDRGRAARNHFPTQCIPWEELLPQPLEDVREFLGITPLPEGWDTADWFIGSKMADSYLSGKDEDKDVKSNEAKLYQTAVEAGVPWRELMRASETARQKICDIVRQGGSVDDMLAALSA